MTTEKKHYINCPICEAECGIEIITRNEEILSIKGDKQNGFSKGFICPKATAIKELYNDPDRLRHPLRRTPKGWEKIGWKEAFDEIENRLKAIRGRYGNDAVALFLGNPNVHYHGNLLYIGFLLKALKTKHRYSSSSLDQLPLMMACQQMFGHQLLFPVPDIDRTDYFMIIGGNPAISGGSIMTAPGVVHRIKKIRKRNGKVVVVDPAYTKTASLADTHFFIRPGADLFFVAAMVHTLFEEGLARPGRVEAYSKGLSTIKEAVKAFTPEKVSSVTGIKAEDIRRLAREFAGAEKAVCYGRLGTCVQEYGTLTTWLIIVFNIIAGKMDQPGGFMFPTPAIDLVGFTALAGEKGWVGRKRTRVSGLTDFGGEFPASALAEEILTEGEGQIKALISVAGNPVLSAPNGRLMDKALTQIDFMVAVDWYITESSRHAHIILPPTHFLEHSNAMMMVNLAGVRNVAAYSKPVLKKSKETRHNWEILSELTARSLSNPLLRIAARLARPELILDFLLRFGPHGSGLRFWRSGLSLNKVRNEPHGVDLGPLVPRLPERLFTKEKRIDLAPELFVKALRKITKNVSENPPKESSEFDLLLIGRRQLMSSNSWFHNAPGMHGKTNRCTLMVNPMDAEKREIHTGDRVQVSSAVGAISLEAETTDRIMPGVVSIPHGWGHHRSGIRLGVASSHPGVSINDITDNRRIDLSGNAAFSGVPVRIEKESKGE